MQYDILLIFASACTHAMAFICGMAFTVWANGKAVRKARAMDPNNRYCPCVDD